MKNANTHKNVEVHVSLYYWHIETREQLGSHFQQREWRKHNFNASRYYILGILGGVRKPENRCAAEDINQELWLHISAEIETPKLRRLNRRLLFAMAHNDTLNWMRAANAQRRGGGQVDNATETIRAGAEGEYSLYENVADATAMAALEQAESRIDNRVGECLSKLPRNVYEAIILCDVKGFSIEEIASIYGRPPGTIKSWLSRGRARLRKLLMASAPYTVCVVTNAVQSDRDAKAENDATEDNSS